MISFSKLFLECLPLYFAVTLSILCASVGENDLSEELDIDFISEDPTTPFLFFWIVSMCIKFALL